MAKKFSLIIAVVSMMILSSVGMAQAYIFDTGTPIGVTPSRLYSDQYLTGQFTVDERSTITEVEGYFTKSFIGTKYLTLTLYTGGAELPATTYAGIRFAIDSDAVGSSWEGVSGLDWTVNPGIYWVSFEVRPQDDFEGSMLNGAPNPAANYAYYDGSWHPDDGIEMGFRVNDSTNAVPEPISMLLFGVGSVGAFIKRRLV